MTDWHIESFFDRATGTFSYVVADLTNQVCAVIDSVLNYDQDAGKISTESADEIIRYIDDQQLTNLWLLETHIHADHITATHYLKPRIGGRTAIGSGIKQVLPMWIPVFNTAANTPADASQFDQLFDDGDVFQIGQLNAKVMLTPGHTPACASYLIRDAVFVGDTLFAPQSGTARVDFPGGSAQSLYDSIQRLYALPDRTRVFLCHDYPDEDAAPCNQMLLKEHKENNRMLNAQTSLATFVERRLQRDGQLSVPKLILPSIQANMRLGDLGEPDDNGIRYLRIPLNQL
ncbi:MBL fold metallo-hydrolase [Marinicella sediminis]|uniref:MBL fold metallo-hydrolase n=1 Tax=Marinicella sediminis TaxID=1792834 RepID=A0ABV7JCN5_9GAMM|nr:MBL fold metallo-hydrolase [Marinicella sediminis]